MYRVEVISNQSVEDDIIELLEAELPDIEYTVVPAVQGKGISSKKLGDTIWPEQNFVLFAYLQKDSAVKMKALVLSLKKRFPREGISVFVTECVDL